MTRKKCKHGVWDVKDGEVRCHYCGEPAGPPLSPETLLRMAVRNLREAVRKGEGKPG